MIAAVVIGAELVRVRGIGEDAVEVDDSVEVAGFPIQDHPSAEAGILWQSGAEKIGFGISRMAGFPDEGVDDAREEHTGIACRQIWSLAIDAMNAAAAVFDGPQK